MGYKELIGKCKTCVGCGLLQNEDFGGRLECNSYVNDEFQEKGEKDGSR